MASGGAAVTVTVLARVAVKGTGNPESVTRTVKVNVPDEVGYP